MFKPGDLVRVLRDKLPKEDEIIVDEHGYLWLVLETIGDDIYCKSLATGNDLYGRGWLWYPSELEKADV